MSITIGEVAPDFELQDQRWQPVRLSDLRGRKSVVLVFYPLSFTRVCEGELCAIRDRLEVFTTERVATWAVSVDAPPTHARWAEEQGFEFPLLSDFWPHGEVARRYGVFDETLGQAMRATFIIDPTGTVIYTDRAPVPQARDQQAWIEALTRVGAHA
jgi:mycoredoxin-dependent peroxiredoxin